MIIMKPNREEQLKAIIRQMLQPLRNLPLDIIIESICGRTILAYDGHAKDEIEKIVDIAAQEINKDGIQSKRPNEVGNYIEPFVREAIQKRQHHAGIPVSATGSKRAMGYPDIEAVIAGKPFYIEIKSYNPQNHDSTQRSFYLSPSEDFKITHNAYHLIFAFSTEQIKTGFFKVKTCTVLDAKELLCDVKYEFNSDNRRMYGDNGLVVLRRNFFNPTL